MTGVPLGAEGDQTRAMSVICVRHVVLPGSRLAPSGVSGRDGSRVISVGLDKSLNVVDAPAVWNPG